MLAGRAVPIALILVLIALAPARAAAGVRPASRNAMYFGLLVGPEPGRLVVGFFDESKGTGRGYDVAVLDLDGDRRPETRCGLVIQKYDEDWINHQFEFSMDGLDYTLAIDNLAPGRLRKVFVDWTVSCTQRTTLPINGMTFEWGHRTAWFINGGTAMSNSPVTAALLPRIRLGPPFRFDVSKGLRGPDPVLSVLLMDAMGGTLRLAFRDRDEILITLVLKRGDEVVLEADGDYG